MKPSLEVARRIQYGIIEREKNVVFADCFDVSARMESARQVGGDFYDCFALPDGRICAVVGDVSGKGVAAAMFMAFAKTLIHEKMTENPEPTWHLRKSTGNSVRQIPRECL